jgi:SAM-dependent methyltransferase
MDGHELAFERRFDAVFSNAALHWMTGPDRVIGGVARALRPGGRFVGEFGGMGNVAAIRTALVAVLHYEHGIETSLDEIWYFPTVEEYSEKLKRSGFSVEVAELIHRPTPASTGIVPWLRTLAAPALALLPEPQRDDAARAAARLLAPALQDSAGNWMADYVRLRFAAVLK